MTRARHKTGRSADTSVLYLGCRVVSVASEFGDPRRRGRIHGAFTMIVAYGRLGDPRPRRHVPQAK
jgi:hypothetical protein